MLLQANTVFRMREFLIRRLRRAPVIEPLWDEFERMLAARDAALLERDAALTARDAALIERDAALTARDAALLERDAALTARDAALIERDAALTARDAALIERDAALTARDAALIATIPDLQTIRATLTSQWDHSHTSVKFQDSLLQFVRDNSELGGSVVEVGCYKGGLTTQLAWICRELGKQLFVVDVSAEYMDIAKRNVDQMVPRNAATWFVGDLSNFMKQHGGDIPRPIVVFIDGDHRYPGVVEDISAVLQTKNMPHALIFHDFGLRSRVPEYAEARVDLAILDSLGRDIRMRGIGEISYSHIEGPFYFEIGLPEGVIILSSDIAESLKRD